MKKDLTWRIVLIAGVLGLALWFSMPLKERINLGLDLQGGMHLILEVETEKAVENAVERMVDNLRDEFRKKRNGDSRVSAMVL